MAKINVGARPSTAGSGAVHVAPSDEPPTGSDGALWLVSDDPAALDAAGSVFDETEEYGYYYALVNLPGALMDQGDWGNTLAADTPRTFEALDSASGVEEVPAGQYLLIAYYDAETLSDGPPELPPTATAAVPTGGSLRWWDTEGEQWVALPEPEAESAASGAVFKFSLNLYGNAAPTAGASLDCLVPATDALGVRATLACAPTTVDAGADNGMACGLEAFAFSAGTCLAYNVEFLVSNAAGTEKLVLAPPDPIALTTGMDLTPDLSGWDVVEQIGTDLAVSASGESVDSTAGGQFVAQLYARFVTDGLTA